MGTASIDLTYPRVDDLHAQLDAEHRAHEQNRRLLGGALERIPALPFTKASEDAVQDGAPVPPQGPPPGHDSPTTQAADTRLWYRRIFGR